MSEIKFFKPNIFMANVMNLFFWRKDPELEIKELRFDLDKLADLSESETLKRINRLRELCPNDVRCQDDDEDEDEEIDGIGDCDYQPQMRKTIFAVPSLGGRLIVKPSAGGYDLHWPSSNKPTFRFIPSKNEIHLARNFKPSDGNRNISALFDLAREKGFDVPAIYIFGNDEFKCAAAREAAKRGLLVEGDEVVMRAREESGLGPKPQKRMKM